MTSFLFLSKATADWFCASSSSAAARTRHLVSCCVLILPESPTCVRSVNASHVKIRTSYKSPGRLKPVSSPPLHDSSSDSSLIWAAELYCLCGGGDCCRPPSSFVFSHYFYGTLHYLDHWEPLRAWITLAFYHRVAMNDAPVWDACTGCWKQCIPSLNSVTCLH